LQLPGLRIFLDSTQLTAVQRRLGGTIGSRGDAGDALHWLCFHGTDGKGGWLLWLESGEINGGAVGGFRWQRAGRTARFDARCRALPDGRRGVELPITLQLGIGEAGALHTLGSPTKRLGGTLLYLHEHEETIHGEPYTATNTLAVLLRGGVVWAIEAWKSTSS
jgi:hypothetical protein